MIVSVECVLSVECGKNVAVKVNVKVKVRQSEVNQSPLVDSALFTLIESLIHQTNTN